MDQIIEPVDLSSLLAHAPGNPVLWRQFLSMLARQLDCECGFMLVSDLLERENTHFLYSFNLSSEFQDDYEDRLNKLDLFNHVVCKQPRRVFCSQTMAPSYWAENSSKPLRNLALAYRFGTAIPCNHRHALSVSVGRRQAFSKQEQRSGIDALQTLLPMLEQSLHEEKRHKINSQIFHHLGKRFDAYIIVDRDLNVLFADPVQSAIISAMDCVNLNGDKLDLNNQGVEQRLLELISNRRGQAFAQNQCLSCQITLIPISSLENLYHWECHKDGYILAFTHDQYINPAVERLTEIFELSKCEAVCALHFLQTPSIPDVATSTCRSQETVRNHLKRTMQKMGVHNQAALMKKLMALSSL